MAMVLCVSCPAVAAAVATPFKAPIAPAPAIEAWTFSLTPYAGTTSLNGSTTVKGRTTDIDASFSEIRLRRKTPMTIFRPPVALLAVLIGWMLFGSSGNAADLTAAWATDAAVCTKVFVKDGNTISFAPDSDFYGSGIIIDKNRIRGKMAVCSIKSRKEDGAVMNLNLVCSGDALIANMQFSLKIDNDHRITRIFPGAPELNTSYFRCPF